MRVDAGNLASVRYPIRVHGPPIFWGGLSSQGPGVASVETSLSSVAAKLKPLEPLIDRGVSLQPLQCRHTIDSNYERGTPVAVGAILIDRVDIGAIGRSGSSVLAARSCPTPSQRGNFITPSDLNHQPSTQETRGVNSQRSPRARPTASLSRRYLLLRHIHV